MGMDMVYGRSMRPRRWLVGLIILGRVSGLNNTSFEPSNPEPVFNSGFSEMIPTSIHLPQMDSEHSLASPRIRGTTGHTFSDNGSLLNMNTIEDSDEEDEAMELDVDEPDDDAETEDNFDDTESQRVAESEDLNATVSMVTAETQSAVDGDPFQHVRPETEDQRGPRAPEDESVAGTDEGDEPTKEVEAPRETGRHRSPITLLEDPMMEPARPSKKRKRDSMLLPGPPKTRVVVTDVAYITYRAVLYYVSPLHRPPTAPAHRLAPQYSFTRTRSSSRLSRPTLSASIHWAVNRPSHVRSPTDRLLETLAGKTSTRPLGVMVDARKPTLSLHWTGTLLSRPRGRSGSASGG